MVVSFGQLLAGELARFSLERLNSLAVLPLLQVHRSQEIAEIIDAVWNFFHPILENGNRVIVIATLIVGKSQRVVRPLFV